MKIKYLYVTLSLLLLGACGEYEQLEQRKIYEKRGDSLYAVKKDSIRKALGTICDMQYDSIYKHALDSLRKKQIQEIRDLMQ